MWWRCTSSASRSPGVEHLPRLDEVIEDPNTDLPQLARDTCRELLDQIVHLTARINAVKKTIGAIELLPGIRALASWKPPFIDDAGGRPMKRPVQ